MKKLSLITSVLLLSACSFDASGPGPEDLCGNGEIDGTEVCDGSNFNGETCESLGFDSGTLSCNADCGSFNTSQCEGGTGCGNGIIDGFETCDGTDLDLTTCASLGFESGTLTCNADCGSFNTSQCVGNPCGNGVIDTNEDCDGENLQGEDCTTLGFDSGILACNAQCAFDTTGCMGNPCGNGVLDTGEDCDGDLFGGATCTSLGFGGGGDLTCTNDCSFNTSDCVASDCGNGIVEGDEACDDGYNDECGSCNSDCTASGTGHTCGDGIVCPEFEACDDNYTDDCGSCNADCTGPGGVTVCGDGVWCPETEECDDGAGGPDGCSATCEVVPPYTCINTPGSISVCTISTCPGTPITTGITSGDTSLGTNDYSDYGTEPGPGKELAYTITVPNNNFIKVTLFNLEGTYDGVIAILDGCPGNLLAYGDLYSNGVVEKTYWFNRTGAPVTVTIMIDGYNSDDEGTFSIDVTIGNAAAPGGGSLLVFNEYVAYVSTPTSEWVEFYHAGTAYLNLNGCRFKTDTLDETISEDILISPGDYFVFNNNASTAVDVYDNVVWGWTAAGGVIQGQSDTLYLYSPGNAVIDQIGPLQTNGFPNVQNNSIALSPAYLGDKTANDSGANWTADPTPTPGYPN